MLANIALPFLSSILILLMSFSTNAAVFKIGDPEHKNGMKVQAIYIQSVRVDDASSNTIDHSMHSNMSNTSSVPSSQSTAQQHDHNNPTMHADGAHHGGHNMDGDIHLEAAVNATSDNNWGFPEGAWLPYLRIHYTVKKTYENFEATGTLIPMAANDGPHYGNNVKLDGPGKYTLRLHISPPDGSIFMRHFDKETGVTDWWKTFEVKRDFTYFGVGKKGGY